MDPVESQKRRAGEAAAELVDSDMRVGFGTGSTARYFTERVGTRVRDGELSGVVAVPTSRSTAELLLDLGVAVVDLDGPLDLAVDGADEIGPDLSLIKGGGGALLREKIVASASNRFVVIGHAAKAVAVLGQRFRLPVEVARFGSEITLMRLQEFGPCEIRTGDHPFVTDNGNYVVDIDTGPITEPASLDAWLSAVPGVVGTGLFVGMTDLVILGNDSGTEERTLA